ncbi:MAG TPA: hypothetical protein DD381_07910 [Lentisphaeria bacterium]|nr:MAG: hypothetical protein A2X47_04475 [Lentisphaerae bacterium GWF2_38_69]HBM16246.1 hypothetical protein [Lentisphaeria bacterium]
MAKNSLTGKGLLVALFFISGLSFSAFGDSVSQTQQNPVSQKSSSAKSMNDQTALVLKSAITEQEKLIASQQKLISDLISNCASKRQISKEQRYLKKMQRDLAKLQKVQLKQNKKNPYSTLLQKTPAEPSQKMPSTAQSEKADTDKQ